MEIKNITAQQKAVCEKYKVEWLDSPLDQKIGVAKNLMDRIMPINALRHPPQNGTAGWYIWAGDTYTSDVDFWDAMHVSHLIELYPDLLKYLGLPAGYRFQIDDKGYEDVWFDEKLLNV